MASVSLTDFFDDRILLCPMFGLSSIPYFSIRRQRGWFRITITDHDRIFLQPRPPHTFNNNQGYLPNGSTSGPTPGATPLLPNNGRVIQTGGVRVLCVADVRGKDERLRDPFSPFPYLMENAFPECLLLIPIFNCSQEI